MKHAQELVRNKWYLRPINRAYRDLKNHSENARYNLLTFTSHKIKNEVIPLCREIADHILQQLEEKKQESKGSI